MRLGLAWALAAMVVAACSGEGENVRGLDEWASPWAEIRVDEQEGWDSPPTFHSGAEDMESVSGDWFEEGGGVEDSTGYATCKAHSDCASGWCLVGQEGGMCALECEDARCEGGSLCEKVSLSGVDAMWVCVPDRTAYCRPCWSDTECPEPGSVCVDEGGTLGRYCSRRCDELQTCPRGFGCQGGVCRAKGGECDCLGDAAYQGLTTPCLRKGVWGECSGVRQCGPGGLTQCSALEAGQDLCDGLDNDCDGKTDEGVQEESCVRGNELGYCVGRLLCVDGKQACDAPEAVVEACDGLDNDCDEDVDEAGAVGCMVVHRDGDGDGFGGVEADCLCSVGGGWVPNGLDCDDTRPEIRPGADEECDGADNNCDGQVDEVCDADGDGFCAGEGTMLGTVWCPEPLSDCNDLDPLANPHAEERCNGVDDDCDKQVDEECDKDLDGYCGKPALVWGPGLVCQYQAPDCREDTKEVYPGAPEVCNARD